MKFETVRIHFLSDVWLVVIQKFCYHSNVTYMHKLVLHLYTVGTS